MKKSILLLAVVLFGASLGAQAQHRGRGRGPRKKFNTSLGLKGGVAFSSFVGDDAGRPDYLTGLQGGLFANFSLSQLVAFQPEVLYSRKGYEFNRTDQRLKLDYIDVPLAFHVNTDGFFFELGP
ncbi:MAG: PorT family protein, partial [Hymenobacter sp.]